MFDVTNEAMLYRNNIKLDGSIKQGVVIQTVEQNSPASNSGLQPNDIIIKVDGKEIQNAAHFKYMLYNHNIGDTIKLTVNRNGKNKDLTLKLSEVQGNN